MKAPSLGEMRHSIEIVRRSNVLPDPYQPDLDHDYAVFLTTRAAVKTRGGVAEFNRVMINGTPATHTFTIRYTTKQIDVRDRVQTVDRSLYSILAVEDVDERHLWINLHCARVGSLDRQSVT